MSDQRAIQPIAPGQRVAKPLEDLKPMKIQEHKPRVERLSMSKQWVLPPRPKPGRKPKAASEKAAKSSKPVPATRKAEPKVSRPGQRSEANDEHESSSSSRYETDPASHRGARSEPRASPHGDYNHTHGAAENHGDPHGDSCGLCTRENSCVCEEIGIKESPGAAAPSPQTGMRRTTLPSLDMILDRSTIKMDAVPIKRQSRDRAMGPGAPMSKFKKAFTFEPMHPSPMMSVPSPLESMPINSEAGCGFCSENTVCVCADTSHPTSLPPAPNEITMSSGPRGSVQLPPISPVQTETESVQLDDDVYGCSECERGPMSMLFCVSLSASRQLAPGAVAIPCNLAFKTLQKHHRFDGCDLGKLVRRLECSKKMVGVQSINRVLQDLERNEFSPQF